MDEGPVAPRQPPSTLEQIMKYLLVSKALPGPIMLSHQPGWPVSWLMPAACASPEKACSTRMALLFAAFNSPYDSYAPSTGASVAPLSRDRESNRTVLAVTIIEGEIS